MAAKYKSFLMCSCPCIDTTAEAVDEAEFPHARVDMIGPRDGAVLVAPWQAHPHMYPEPISFAPRSVPMPRKTNHRRPQHENLNSDTTSGSMDAASSSATTQASPDDEGMLEICFLISGKRWRREKQEIIVSFASKPLGMQFVRGKKPFVVKSVERGGVAANLGVKPGMVVRSIQGQSVSDMEYSKFIVLLNEQSRILKATSSKETL